MTFTVGLDKIGWFVGIAIIIGGLVGGVIRTHNLMMVKYGGFFKPL